MMHRRQRLSLFPDEHYCFQYRHCGGLKTGGLLAEEQHYQYKYHALPPSQFLQHCPLKTSEKLYHHRSQTQIRKSAFGP